MAAGKKVVKKRRERKNIEKGVVHIALLSTTRSLPLPIQKVTLFHGRPQASSDTRAPRSLLRLQLRWQQSRRQKRPQITA